MNKYKIMNIFAPMFSVLMLIYFLFFVGKYSVTMPKDYKSVNRVSPTGSRGNGSKNNYSVENKTEENRLAEIIEISDTLVSASRNGLDKMVLELLEQGININSSGSFSNEKQSGIYTALMAACSGDNENTVKLLLERGADPNLVFTDWTGDSGGDFTALMLAINSKNVNRNIIQLLLDAGANPALGSASYGRNAFDLAMGAKDKEIFRMIFDSVDKSILDRKNPSEVFGTACANGYIDIVKYYLDKGHDPNKGYGYKSGQSPFVDAARGGHFQIVKLLIDKGVKLDSVDEIWSERTALTFAMIGGYDSLAKFLIDNGVPTAINEKNLQENVNAAAGACGEELYELFLAKGNERGIVPQANNLKGFYISAVKREENTLVERLLKLGVESNYKIGNSLKNDKRSSALDHAKEKGHEEIAKTIEDSLPPVVSNDNNLHESSIEIKKMDLLVNDNKQKSRSHKNINIKEKSSPNRNTNQKFRSSVTRDTNHGKLLKPPRKKYRDILRNTKVSRKVKRNYKLYSGTKFLIIDEVIGDIILLDGSTLIIEGTLRGNIYDYGGNIKIYGIHEGKISRLR